MFEITIWRYSAALVDVHALGVLSSNSTRKGFVFYQRNVIVVELMYVCMSTLFINDIIQAKQFNNICNRTINKQFNQHLPFEHFDNFGLGTDR